MGEYINKYGAAYYFGSRILGVSIIFGLYQAILSGMDVRWILEYFGVSENLGEKLGTFAASVTLAAFTAPINFILLPILAPRLANTKLFKKLRETMSER
eukprot:CAMPEP_0114516810 /NCGR_PEP_ID=MMETSP0109-20121206/17535_1 /TAXON_ID=29199 /ORGANISM="Chlorarachnion reptans, Strain CCCM449" /LENGTH=98 /DNA_ID=CAMNT_0001697241 /DNA_START=669 /DNA_END=965 /DNA_ORIENTATION=+